MIKNGSADATQSFSAVPVGPVPNVGITGLRVQEHHSIQSLIKMDWEIPQATEFISLMKS